MVVFGCTPSLTGKVALSFIMMKAAEPHNLAKRFGLVAAIFAAAVKMQLTGTVSPDFYQGRLLKKLHVHAH